MRLAYADPPYLGKSGRYDHPEASKWDDLENHRLLLECLDETYDGWAYSCLSTSLRLLLPAAPERARVAAWVKPWCAFKRNVRVAYSWEPVIFAPGRDRSADGAPVGRDHLSAPMEMRTGLVGAKPAAFCLWVADLLGFIQGDELVDLFPGTGVMERTLERRLL